VLYFGSLTIWSDLRSIPCLIGLIFGS